KTEQSLDNEWLHKWIKDNKALRESGDKYAVEVYEKFNKVEMTPFPNLTDKDIDDILEYTTNPPAPEPAADAATAGADAGNSAASMQASQAESQNSKIILISMVAIAGLLIWLLLKLNQLVKLQQSEELRGAQSSQAVSWGEMYRKYHYVGKGLLALLGIFA